MGKCWSGNKGTETEKAASLLICCRMEGASDAKELTDHADTLTVRGDSELGFFPSLQ
jgi:hypothetical protein